MTQLHRRPVRQLILCHHLHQFARLATDDIEQQACRSLGRTLLQFIIDATLEAVGGFRVQSVLAGTSGNRQGREEGAFQQDVAGFRTNARMFAAHDARQCQGALVIGNQQSIVTQLNGLAIEQRNLLACHSHPHPNALMQLGQIERMQRLPQLQHHVVGHIHHRVDAAHAGPAQALLHPDRCRTAQVHIANDAPDITRAGIRRFHLNVKAVGMYCRNRRNLRRRQRQPIEHAHFAGETGHTQTVAAVRGQIDVDDRILQLQIIGDIGSQRRIAWQWHQAVGLLGEPQFGFRAQHALGIHAAQLRGFNLQAARQLRTDSRQRNPHTFVNIGRSTDHLKGMTSVEHLTNPQFIGIRMGRDLAHLGHHHIGALATYGLDAIDFEPCHGDLCRQRLGIHRRIDPLAQPLFANFHGIPSLDRCRPAMFGRRPATYLNWFSKRRSFSKNMRKSLTPYRSMVRRSTPRPKANPV